MENIIEEDQDIEIEPSENIQQKIILPGQLIIKEKGYMKFLNSQFNCPI